MPKKTMKELAVLTGFSPTTISRVLTRHKSVNAVTRRKVEEALNKIDYAPTRISRKKFAKNTVLVISGETSSNFHTRVFSIISSRLRARGYYVLVGHTGFDELLEEQFVEYAQALEFCGLVMITPVDSPPLTRLLHNTTCPVVLVNRYLRSIDLDAVYMDNYRAGYMVGKHLADMGHRRVACLGSEKSTAIADRLSGFADAMADAALSPDSYRIFDGDLTRTGGHFFGEKYVKTLRKYTAVFCLNEPMAQGFVETVVEKGLAIPDDVSVICVAPATVRIMGNVKITCVIHNAELIGQTAATMLLERLDGLDQPPRKIVYPPKLCVQDSVKTLPWDRPCP